MAPNSSSQNSGKSSRNQLSLEMKIEVIKMHDEKKMSCRAIVNNLNMQGHRCGKTQVQNIVKSANSHLNPLKLIFFIRCKILTHH